MLAALEILELQKWPNSKPISQFMEFSEMASTMYFMKKKWFPANYTHAETSQRDGICHWRGHFLPLLCHDC
jgi:hypothetical protein